MLLKLFRKDKKSLFRKLKITVNNDMRDYSKEDFFVKKDEIAKELLAKVSFPQELLSKK